MLITLTASHDNIADSHHDGVLLGNLARVGIGGDLAGLGAAEDGPLVLLQGGHLADVHQKLLPGVGAFVLDGYFVGVRRVAFELLVEGVSDGEACESSEAGVRAVFILGGVGGG